ncbi:hypothetical protein EG329_003968 [Mollisiaceae sp. DMI_Dod_QoI]|nr:hypothetical protein EG329_003968 [Helotiales sp. DMI_Dod_QoI]
MSFFHLRVMNSPEDFQLLTPTDPFTELGDYTCGEKRIHWFFCRRCGVRCFAFAGEGETVDFEVEFEIVMVGKVKRKMKVWKPKSEGWVEKENGYLSINAATLNAGQEGLDLREWTEKGWIAYLDMKGDGEARLGKPHEGGMY